MARSRMTGWNTRGSNPNRTKKYSVSVGTRGSKTTREVPSLAIMKHPIDAWFESITKVIAAVGCEDERARLRELRERIDMLGEFTGVQTFRIDLPCVGIQGEVICARIG